MSSPIDFKTGVDDGIPRHADLSGYCQQLAERARKASRQLATLATSVKDRWLLESADALLDSADEILAANALDVELAGTYGLTAAATERLKLDRRAIEGIAKALREIAEARDPVGETMESWRRPNGLEIRKVRVPIGTILFIYESRPNVTVDAAGICVKSGNAVILRGGKEAVHSSTALVRILNDTAAKNGIPEGAVQLVETSDRQAVGHLLTLDNLIDIVIPRGGKSLIERVVKESRIPVLKHFDGNCHVYVDARADLQMAEEIVVNSKCQRMSVCNACESLVVHRSVADRFLPAIARRLDSKGVEMRGDTLACQLIETATPASQEDWGTEYLGPIISLRVVGSLDEAIAHINRYGSRHTDAIVTGDPDAARRFQLEVDSAVVLVNASTRFNDGGEFGFGAEIGISTDKLHARGPCGLRELTTYKYLVDGKGQVRT